MVPETNPTTERIRRLNDAFRQKFLGGRVFTTPGIRAFPPADIQAIATQVNLFADFSAENDPHGEHDFGSFRYNGELICGSGTQK